MSVPLISLISATDYAQKIGQAADALTEGKLVVIPTETVYGAAGLLNQPAGLKALKALRGREEPAPFTVHLAEPEEAEQYVGDIGELGRRMIRKLWPGPVGLVFDVPADRRAEVAKKFGVSEAELFDAAGTITLRCPDDLIARDVIHEADGPVGVIVAWDAPAGSNVRSPAPTLAQTLDGKVEMVLDGGPTRFSLPSTLLKVTGDQYEMIRKGVYDERIIERLLRTTLLFVCSGNTCRSPMSEAIARHLIADSKGIPDNELEKHGVNVVSAGAYATPGSRATRQAAEAVRTLGADLSSHRSKQLTPEMINQADFIYTMGQGHAMAVLSMVPSARKKVVTLDPEGDIDDPIGGSAELYIDLAGELKRLIEIRLKEKELMKS